MPQCRGKGGLGVNAGLGEHLAGGGRRGAELRHAGRGLAVLGGRRAVRAGLGGVPGVLYGLLDGLDLLQRGLGVRDPLAGRLGRLILRRLQRGRCLGKRRLRGLIGGRLRRIVGGLHLGQGGLRVIHRLDTGLSGGAVLHGLPGGALRGREVRLRVLQRLPPPITPLIATEGGRK